MKLKLQAYLVLAYGLLLLVGGIIGHQKANSLPSLVMGSTFAVLAVTSAIFMLKKNPWGQLGAFFVSSVLAIFFGYRFFITEKFMPAGMMFIVSVLVAGILFYAKKSLEYSNKKI